LLAIAKGEMESYAGKEFKVTLERLYEHYKEYCVAHGIQAVTQSANFSKQVTNVLGEEAVEDKDGNKWGKKYLRDGKKTLMGYQLLMGQFVEKVQKFTKLEVPLSKNPPLLPWLTTMMAGSERQKNNTYLFSCLLLSMNRMVQYAVCVHLVVGQTLIVPDEHLVRQRLYHVLLVGPVVAGSMAKMGLASSSLSPMAIKRCKIKPKVLIITRGLKTIPVTLPICDKQCFTTLSFFAFVVRLFGHKLPGGRHGIERVVMYFHGEL